MLTFSKFWLLTGNPAPTIDLLISWRNPIQERASSTHTNPKAEMRAKYSIAHEKQLAIWVSLDLESEEGQRETFMSHGTAESRLVVFLGPRTE